jgi:hypothetical protein
MATQNSTGIPFNTSPPTADGQYWRSVSGLWIPGTISRNDISDATAYGRSLLVQANKDALLASLGISPSKMLLSVSILPTPTGTTVATMASLAFTVIPFSTVLINDGNGWNATNKTYSIPATAIPGQLYMIVANFRLQASGSGASGIPVDVSYYVGSHTSNVDGDWGIWFRSNQVRNGSQVTRLVTLNPGDLVRTYSYVDTATNPVGIVSAGFTITSVG